MKKMYKQPESQIAEIQPTGIMQSGSATFGGGTDQLGGGGSGSGSEITND